LSHSAVYLIDVKGEEFNSFLPSHESLSKMEIDEYRDSDILLEFSLKEDNNVISAEITGEVTLLWAPWRYSVFLTDEQEQIGPIKIWEEKLLDLVGEVKIYRIDEALLEQWELEQSEYWFRDHSNFMKLISWLVGQDKLHWCELR